MNKAVKNAKWVLKHYNGLVASLSILDRRIQIAIAHGAPHSLPQARLDETGIRSTSKETTMVLVGNIVELQHQKAATQELIKVIDDTLQEISYPKGCEMYGKLLRLWYIEKKSRVRICRELDYSRSTLYRKLPLALNEFAVSYDGEKALGGAI